MNTLFSRLTVLVALVLLGATVAGVLGCGARVIDDVAATTAPALPSPVAASAPSSPEELDPASLEVFNVLLDCA